MNEEHYGMWQKRKKIKKQKLSLTPEKIVKKLIYVFLIVFFPKRKPKQ